MNNIIDYVKQYGKLTLDEAPFNEVDSLCLSQLIYLKFGQAFDDLNAKSLPTSLHMINESELKEELFRDERFKKINRDLFDAMSESERFQNMKLFYYVDLVDVEWEIQFSAGTFIFENGFTYIAFRGTDDSIIGWKEDFNMAYMTPIPSQEKAVSYFNKICGGVAGKVTLGGHSKGGNLAIYAGIKAFSEFSSRIDCIYSHDGPGFHAEVMECAEYNKIRDKIRKTVPRSSIIGLSLETYEDYEVVCCRNFGVFQHDPYNWIIEGNAFKKAQKRHTHTDIQNITFNRWIAGITFEERQQIVEMIFEIINGSGADNLNDFKGEWFVRTKGILESLNNLKPSDKEMLQEFLKKLSLEVNETIRDLLKDKLYEEKQKYKTLIEDFSKF